MYNMIVSHFSSYVKQYKQCVAKFVVCSKIHLSFLCKLPDINSAIIVLLQYPHYSIKITHRFGLSTDKNGADDFFYPYSFISSPGFTSSAPGTLNFFALAASYSFPGDICTGIECFAAISSAQCIVSGMSIV